MTDRQSETAKEYVVAEPFLRVMTDTPIQTAGWRPLDAMAPREVREIAKAIARPTLGQHVGRVTTMYDGRWLVLKHQAVGPDWESYMILPGPPLA